MQASDIQIEAKHILDTRNLLNKLMAERSGQTLEQIEKDTDRDNFMSSADAMAYGLIDKVVETENVR
jgi:ATP-dependent Clp protease protease subunit